MVAIAPFRALRYNLDRIDLSTVVAPPYDVISPADQESLYARSPYNIVRLILGKQRPEDTSSSNCYTRAQETFSAWRHAGVLMRDAAPAFYLYEHAFTWEGQRLCRLGCVALLVFDGSVPEGVLHHEATFEGPKADRTRLLEAVPANLSPIFFIYHDPTGQLHDRLLHWSREHAPLAAAQIPALPTQTAGQTSDDVVRVWAVREPDVIRDLIQRFAPGRVLIADGHHRFSVAVSKRHQFGAVMGYFSWMEDPAVRVRPIHRVIEIGPGGWAQWDARLKTLCHLRPVSGLEPVTSWLADGAGQGRFGYYQQGRFSQMVLREEALAEWLLYPSVPLPLAGLDVTILHELLMPQLLEPLPTEISLREISQAEGLSSAARLHKRPRPWAGSFIPSAPRQEPSYARYTPDPSEAIAMADGHPGRCAWFLRPLPLTQVFALAAQGLTLPQKTTYFYPKLLSGLLLNPFD